MPGKVLTIQQVLVDLGLSDQHQTAAVIASFFDQWNSARTRWLDEKKELRNYLFATDTSGTSNSTLPWKNSTTVPKLTQIRDNLHANYMAALFPQQDWIKWEGVSQEDEKLNKRRAIENYMNTKLTQDKAEIVLSQLLLDYIDYGNCFATVEWVDESWTNSDTNETITGYVGPRIVRVSPYDIVFNPLAPSFDETPKIVRTLKTMGDVAKEVDKLDDNDPYKRGVMEALDNGRHLRGGVTSGTVKGEHIKSEGMQIDGFGTYHQYLNSGYVEVLTFYGDIYNVETGVYEENRVIEIIDRLWVVRNEPNPAWTTRPLFYHAGWRMRPDNLYAMGPLDNLVGMQYRIDHLENLKADVFDLIAFPVQKVRGYVEDYDYQPGAKIFVGDDGDVEFMRPDTTALNADLQIRDLQDRMEELAGAPREAMGIRSPGEKTKFEVQQLDNAASRLFLNKVQHFEKVFLEPLLNAMLAVGRQHMQASDITRTLDSEIDAIIFQTVTKDDITANGALRPRGARHFAQRANTLQNLISLMNSPAFADPSVSVHLSGKQIAQLLEELSDLDQFTIYGDNIRVIEQGETQALAAQAAEQAEIQAATPPGISEADPINEI